MPSICETLFQHDFDGANVSLSEEKFASPSSERGNDASSSLARPLGKKVSSENEHQSEPRDVEEIKES